jgi:hypothetical protein
MQTWRDQIEIVTTSAALLRTGSICLLRPDGYLAARGSMASPDNLTGYLKRLSGPAPARELAPATEQHDQ